MTPLRTSVLAGLATILVVGLSPTAAASDYVDEKIAFALGYAENAVAYPGETAEYLGTTLEHSLKNTCSKLFPSEIDPCD